MGNDSSKASSRGLGGGSYFDDGSTAGDDDGGSLSLWEGVPEPVLWLVQSQIRTLLANHSSALLYRPESLATGADAAAEEAETDVRRGGELQTHEAALAHSALRDKALSPRLQRVLDRLVPAHLSEVAFWDNFFSHVDVIKVRLVTDYLTAQDGARAERERKHEGWVQLFDAMEPEMRIDVRRAAERIAARQQPAPPSAIELQMGLDQHRSPRWHPDGEAWLEYVEDGPFEVSKVLKKALQERGEYDALMGGAGPAGAEAAAVAVPSALWRSPDDRGDVRASFDGAAAPAVAKPAPPPPEPALPPPEVLQVQEGIPSPRPQEQEPEMVVNL